jgi:flagellin-like hook-associated protein FlgL
MSATISSTLSHSGHALRSPTTNLAEKTALGRLESPVATNGESGGATAISPESSATVELSRASRWMAARSAAVSQAAGLLSRMSELRLQTDDVGDDDVARSEQGEEFDQLRERLAGLGGELVSGRKVFGGDEEATEMPAEFSSDEAVVGAGDSSEAIAADSFAGDLADAASWVSTFGSMAMGDDGTFYPNAEGYYGAVESKASFRGAFELTFDLYLPGAVDSLDVTLGGVTLSNLVDTVNTNKWEWHSVRIAYDGAGSAATYLDGSDSAADARSDVGEASGKLGLSNYGLGSVRLRNFSISAYNSGASPVSSGSENLLAVTETEELDALDLETIDEALDELATIESETGVETEAAEETTMETENLDDIFASYDDAEQATAMARQDILRQSGNALMAQANLDEQSALVLLN